MLAWIHGSISAVSVAKGKKVVLVDKILSSIIWKFYVSAELFSRLFHSSAH